MSRDKDLAYFRMSLMKLGVRSAHVLARVCMVAIVAIVDLL